MNKEKIKKVVIKTGTVLAVVVSISLVVGLTFVVGFGIGHSEGYDLGVIDGLSAIADGVE